MEKVKNLKVNGKKIISALLTTTVLSTMAGCCLKNHEEVINEQNDKISALEQNIAELENSKKELENLNAQLHEQINELTETPQPTVGPKSTTLYNNQKSISSTYSYVGDEFKSKTGDVCRRIRVPGDGAYAAGIYNVTKNRIDIPCSTYDNVYYEFKSQTGDVCRKISVPNDEAYAKGIYNVSQCREEIPCETYKEIKEVEVGIYQCITPDNRIKVYKLK